MTDVIDKLCEKNTTKIVLLVMDGVGGIQGENGQTELQAAKTPNLDTLAKKSVCGVMDPVMKGVTPGSGPAHFSLFGYDPVTSNVGRGVLAACGINFPLKHGNLCARINFATVDGDGNVIDRRAGRISNEENQRICEKIKKALDVSDLPVEFFMETVSEHRAVVILRGENLSDDLEDTDPQKTGVPPLSFKGGKNSGETISVLNKLFEKLKTIIADEEKANMMLFRGFATFAEFPSFEKRFLLKSAAIASYPMYKGLSRLVGMHVFEGCKTNDDEIKVLEEQFNDFDFFFIHIKKTDSYGEDGNFESKVHVIEEVDALLPRILALKPDVLAITADHSTPSSFASHSWHPVPVCIHSEKARLDRCAEFNEVEFAEKGGLGRFPSMELMGLALAHAMRLKKFGA